MIGLVIRKLIRFALSKLESAACRFRRHWVNLTHAGVELEDGVRIKSSVKIMVTDGGRLKISANTIISAGAIITVKGGQVTIGAHSFIGPWAVICANQNITIGMKALIAERVTIRDQNHKTNTIGFISENGMEVAPICIGDDVWLAANVVVLMGSNIGSGAVIGANSVVNSTVGENQVYAGAPARYIKMRFLLNE